MLHSWRWSLPALLEGGRQGQAIRASEYRKSLGLARSGGQRRDILRAMGQNSGDHPRAPEGS
jgi:hypothetical protein